MTNKVQFIEDDMPTLIDLVPNKIDNNQKGKIVVLPYKSDLPHQTIQDLDLVQKLETSQKIDLSHKTNVPHNPTKNTDIQQKTESPLNAESQKKTLHYIQVQEVQAQKMTSTIESVLGKKLHLVEEGAVSEVSQQLMDELTLQYLQDVESTGDHQLGELKQQTRNQYQSNRQAMLQRSIDLKSLRANDLRYPFWTQELKQLEDKSKLLQSVFTLIVDKQRHRMNHSMNLELVRHLYEVIMRMEINFSLTGQHNQRQLDMLVGDRERILMKQVERLKLEINETALKEKQTQQSMNITISTFTAFNQQLDEARLEVITQLKEIQKLKFRFKNEIQVEKKSPTLILKPQVEDITQEIDNTIDLTYKYKTNDQSTYCTNEYQYTSNEQYRSKASTKSSNPQTRATKQVKLLSQEYFKKMNTKN